MGATESRHVTTSIKQLEEELQNVKLENQQLKIDIHKLLIENENIEKKNNDLHKQFHTEIVKMGELELDKKCNDKFWNYVESKQVLNDFLKKHKLDWMKNEIEIDWYVKFIDYINSQRFMITSAQ